MNVETVVSDRIIHAFMQWHEFMRSNDLEQAIIIHNQVKESINDIQDSTLHLHYQLLNSRHLLLSNDFSAAHATLQQIEHHGNRNDLLGFYFHFFNGILLTNQDEYELAETSFLRGYHLLKHVSDETVKADFYYKASVLYYHIHQPLTALNYAREALKVLIKHQGFEMIIADCENILGLACTSLKQYARAEEHFLSALDITQKHNFHQLGLLIRYNLGFLYAEQNISELAIRYLLEIYEQEGPHYKTLFLLAREHFKLNDFEKADLFVQQGIQHTNEEYKHHFSVVQAFHSQIGDSELENVLNEGLVFFEKHELWGFIENYCGELARHFHKKEQYERASFYFNKSFEAKQTLQRKEALK